MQRIFVAPFKGPRDKGRRYTRDLKFLRIGLFPLPRPNIQEEWTKNKLQGVLVIGRPPHCLTHLKNATQIAKKTRYLLSQCQMNGRVHSKECIPFRTPPRFWGRTTWI